MGRIDEQLTEQFYRWELRGRGWQVFGQPVALEPPFLSFTGHFLPKAKHSDQGKRHTRLSGFVRRLQSVAQPTPEDEPINLEIEPDAEPREASELVELQMSLPLSRTVPALQVETFLRHACRPGESLSLELLGTERETVPQFVASPRTATRIEIAAASCFPGLVCAPVGGSDEARSALHRAWHDSESHFAVVELGLGREWMLPIGNPRGNLLASVAAAMDGLGKKELALLQVMFEPVRAPWAESMVRAVANDDGTSFFKNHSDLVKGAALKAASPLFAVVIRLVSSAADTRRTWEIIADVAAALSALARPGSNYLVPLDDANYPVREHESDIVTRLSRRSGMLLSLEELIPLITPPTSTTARRLRRETKRTNAAPDIVGIGTLSLGVNSHAGGESEVFLSPEFRVRHTHIIGASGSGKSTLLLNLIIQDIEHGEGVAVLDPHGDLVDAVLARIPTHRIADVVLLDPSDEDFPIGFNILAAHSDFERSLLASDLVSVFRRLSTSWGDQMESVLRNAILAFLKSSRGGTLADLSRFLTDAAFRKDFLLSVSDPMTVHYWQRTFPLLTGGKSIGPVLTRLDEFLSQAPIRNMVSQDANRLDFSEIIDSGKILLVRLPQGLIGRENTALLGSLVTAKLQMAAMSRQRLPAAQRRDFWCYLDEFHHFITTSMAEILAGARKYRLGLILAHQDLRQLETDRDVSGAVLSNCCTRIVFKVSDADARTLESGFAHFESNDLMNLGIGEALCRVERSEFDFNLRVPNSETVDENFASEMREKVIAASREKYSRPRSEVEEDLFRKWQTATEPATPPNKKEKVSAPIPTPIVPEVVSETPPAVSEIPSRPAVEEPEPKPPVEIGRGGTLHRDTQRRIKFVAEELGFRATMEAQVGSRGVDLLLERGTHRIAVEFNSTTGVTHELQNILKCLAGDFSHIALVSVDSRKLQQVEMMLRERVSETATRVGFYEVEPFLDFIRALPQPAPSEPTQQKGSERKIMGWTVKTETREQTPEEAAEAKAQMLRALAESLRKPPQ